MISGLSFMSTPWKMVFTTSRHNRNGTRKQRVCYNAFPHFPDPERLIATLSGLLKPGGTLTVAHGMSREKIDAHHHGSAHHVSNGLMTAEDLASIFKESLTVTTMISNDRMYQVVGQLDCRTM